MVTFSWILDTTVAMEKRLHAMYVAKEDIQEKVE